MGVHTLGDLLFNPIEGTTTDKQDVPGIHMDIILVRMLTATLGRHVHHRTLQQFQKSLLHTLTTDITGDRRVIALTGNLIDLVDEHDTPLGCLHVVISHLEQTGQDALHILAHITSLSKYRRIHDGEGHVEQFGNRTGQQGLTRSRGAHHDDVALLDLHTVVGDRLLQTLIVVIYRYSEITLGLVLSDHIVIKIGFDLLRLRHLLQFELLVLRFLGVRHILLHDMVSLLGTVLADKPAQARDQQFYFTFTSSAETTCFLHPSSYFFLVSTVSIIPYSLASSAVIQ